MKMIGNQPCFRYWIRISLSFGPSLNPEIVTQELFSLVSVDFSEIDWTHCQCYRSVSDLSRSVKVRDIQKACSKEFSKFSGYFGFCIWGSSEPDPDNISCSELTWASCSFSMNNSDTRPSNILILVFPVAAGILGSQSAHAREFILRFIRKVDGVLPVENCLVDVVPAKTVGSAESFIDPFMHVYMSSKRAYRGGEKKEEDAPRIGWATMLSKGMDHEIKKIGRKFDDRSGSFRCFVDGSVFQLSDSRIVVFLTSVPLDCVPDSMGYSGYLDGLVELSMILKGLADN